jgi:predicted peptidase
MRKTSAFRKQLFTPWLIIALIFVFSCTKGKPDNASPDNPNASPYSLTAKPIKISTHINGYYEYLPQGYSTDAANTNYPLLIFFHGGEEMGQDAASLEKLLKHGPLKFVKSGTFPTSFNVNGKTYKYIIIAPQFTSTEDPYSDEIDQLIEYAKQKYKVDASRIYLTGLSIGGGLCWNYVGRSANYANKIAAVVPVASYINEQRDEFKVDAAKAHIIAASNMPIWSTHNNGDNLCPLAWITRAHDLVKSSNPSLNPLPRLTIFNASIHEGWTKTYDPSFKENNRNIYEWMLQYHR